MGQQEPSQEDLAKQTQNPVADLISVPLQNNFNFGAGLNHNKMLYVLNVQPVIPIKLNDDWNLITRTIMPIINQPSLFPTAGGWCTAPLAPDWATSIRRCFYRRASRAS